MRKEEKYDEDFIIIPRKISGLEKQGLVGGMETLAPSHIDRLGIFDHLSDIVQADRFIQVIFRFFRSDGYLSSQTVVTGGIQNRMGNGELSCFSAV